MSQLSPLSIGILALLSGVLTACLVVARGWSMETVPPVTDRLPSHSPSVSSPLRNEPFSQPRFLNAPRDLEISVFAAGLGKSRFMAVGPHGDLFVSVPGKILVLPDGNRDGSADRTGAIYRISAGSHEGQGGTKQ